MIEHLQDSLAKNGIYIEYELCETLYNAWKQSDSVLPFHYFVQNQLLLNNKQQG